MSAASSNPLVPAAPAAGFEAQFEQETRTLLLDRLRLGLKVGVVLYVLFGFLDLLVAPQLWREFVTVRLAVAACTAMTLFLVHKSWGVRHVKPISVGIMFIGAMGLSIMSARWTGFENQYYVGNMLAIFLVGLYFPWGAATTALYGSLVVGTYALLNVLAHDQSIRIAAMPLFFLTGTVALTVWAAAAAYRHRRESLAMRLELEDKNTQLKSLDEAKTGFFANVSHELRTPLMLILGPIETMLRHEADDADALLQAMQTNAHRLMRQVNLILNFSKIEAGQMQIQRETADLGELLGRLVNAAKPYAESRKITLSGSGFETLPPCAIDIEKIETVANNLLSNALKFTPDGGAITLRAGTEGEGKRTIWFEVSDTGCGIPADQVEKVFERFHQVKGGKAGKIQGTGLGLSLSKEFAELHGGTIKASSVLGEGTTFRVELPNVDAPASGEIKDAKSSKRASTAATEFADLAKPSLEDARGGGPQQLAPADAPLLLVVEDNPDMRAFISGILAKRWRVEVARNGREGLETARRIRPDLIVSDVMMPEMNGFEMVEALRKDKAFTSTPIIFLSARTGSEAVVQGLTLGAVDYVNKPFKQTELEARVESQLRLRSAERALAERDSRLIAMGQMTGTIAHDLRSPLTTVIGRLAILRMTADAIGAKEHMDEDIEMIDKQTGRIEGMVHELLEFVRGQDVTLALQSTVVADFVRRIGDELRPAMSEMKVQLAVEIKGDAAAALELDQERMQRVIENLLNNSRDALVQQTQGHPDPRIRLVCSADAREVRIQVSDNGPGIPDEIADRLFQPGATAGKAHGTGLGLSIVRNFVQAHKGRIEVAAKGDDGGACFTMTFPRHASQTSGAEAPQKTELA